MRLVNLTGHLVRLEHDGLSVTVPSSSQRARVASRPYHVDTIEIYGIPIPRYVQSERRILDLPDPEDDVIYLVSGIVADAAQREDVWAVGRKIAAKGEVEGGQALIRYERLAS